MPPVGRKGMPAGPDEKGGRYNLALSSGDLRSASIRWFDHIGAKGQGLRGDLRRRIHRVKRWRLSGQEVDAVGGNDLGPGGDEVVHEFSRAVVLRVNPGDQRRIEFEPKTRSAQVAV